MKPRAATLGALAVLAAGTTLANGDLFFEAMEVPGKPQYVIFGNAKTDRGQYLEGVAITVSVSEPRLTYTSETGLLGRYRTLDIGRAIEGLGYDLDPSKIQVTAQYPNYRVVRRAYRGKFRQKAGAVEMDFVLAAVAKH